MANWEEINNQYGKKYKDYAPEGEWETKIAELEQVESSQKKTPGLKFTFQDNDDYAFPKFGTTHWISFKNDNWRMHHFKELMKVLGASEEQAEKAVDVCESKSDQKAIVKAYADAFKRLVLKNPTVKVAVFKRNYDSKYCDCDFADNSVRMNRPETEGSTAPKAIEDDGMFANAEPLSNDELDALPF